GGHMENSRRNRLALVSVRRRDVELRSAHGKLLQSSAGSEQPRWHSLDGPKQAGHWHSRHQQSGDDRPCCQSRLHSPGKLGRRSSERSCEGGQYRDHLLTLLAVLWVGAIDVNRLRRTSHVLEPGGSGEPPLPNFLPLKNFARNRDFERLGFRSQRNG